MKISVMSREGIEQFSEEISKKTAIISIRSFDSREAILSENENIVDILRLCFDDYDFKSETSMTKQDGEEIAEFVIKQISQNNVDELIVQCLMGISRSAGIAMAIYEVLCHEPSPFQYNRRMDPNLYCYEITKHALIEKLTELNTSH